MEAVGSMGVLTGNALALVMCLWKGRQFEELHSLEISVLHLFFPKWPRPRAISSLHLYRTVKRPRVSPIKPSFTPKLEHTYSQTCLIPPQPLLLEKTNRPSTTTPCPGSLHLHPTLGAPRAKVKVSSGDRQGPGYTLWKALQLGTSWTCYTSKIVS